jgi:hypothetical protein
MSDKQIVSTLISDDVIDVILPFTKSQHAATQQRACWCFFGMSASSGDNRDLCLRRGILSLAVDIMLDRSPDSVIDMCGQIIYGMFHLKPPPSPELTGPFFDKCPRLLRLPESTLKYILWSIHFLSGAEPNRITEDIILALRPLFQAPQAPVLTPLLVIVGGLFNAGSTVFDPYLSDLRAPLKHVDSLVRLQACRAVADYVRNPKTVDEMFTQNIFPIMIKISETDEFKVKEQSVYSLLRGFGLGDEEQRRKLADLGALGVVLKFTVLATPPFNSNLLDCVHSMAETDSEFFVPKLQQIGAVPVLYQIIACPDQNLTNRAANLLGIVGDDYKPNSWG